MNTCIHSHVHVNICMYVCVCVGFAAGNIAIAPFVCLHGRAMVGNENGNGARVLCRDVGWLVGVAPRSH